MCAHDHEQVRQQRHRRAGVLERHLGQARNERCKRIADAVKVIGHDAVFLERLDQIPGEELDGGAVFEHTGDGQRVEELLGVVLHLLGKALRHAGGVAVGSAEDVAEQRDEVILQIVGIVLPRGDEARRDRLTQVGVEFRLCHVDLEDLAEVAARDVLRVDAPRLEVVGPVDVAAVVRDAVELVEHLRLVVEVVCVTLGRHDAVDTVAGKVPAVERDIGHKVVGVDNVVDVFIYTPLHFVLGCAHGRLVAVAVQVVRAETDASAEAAAVVEHTAEHVGHGRAAAVAADPELHAAGDAGLGDVCAQVVEHLIAAHGEACVLAGGTEACVAAPLGVVVVAAHADGDEGVLAAVVADGLAGAVDTDGVGLGRLGHPLVGADVFKAALLGKRDEVAVARCQLILIFGILAGKCREGEAQRHLREILPVRVAALGEQLVAVGKGRRVVMGIHSVTGGVAHRDGLAVARARRGRSRHERYDQNQTQQQADDAFFHVFSSQFCSFVFQIHQIQLYGTKPRLASGTFRCAAQK